MKLLSKIQENIQEVWKNILRIFSPPDDDYPKTGIQPFEGESSEGKENL
ncbi:MAG: hypothetical protein MUD14_14565 [Hydrococcus sp. Prado102]|jgi:hypothetical protein|nr:hypothetical protein [Hydrococcus sp. Prado102]